MKYIHIEDSNRVCRIRLARKNVHNALNPEMIDEIEKAFIFATKSKDVRVVILESEGDIFCSGADLQWMKNSVKESKKKNLKSANALYDMYKKIYSCPKPTIAKIQGSAFGGGVGLIACCDVAIMVKKATLSLSELKLGLIPSTIAPFFQRKIGFHNLRFYGLCSKKIPSEECRQIGLVHEVVSNSQELESKTNQYAENFIQLSPQAIRRFKKLCDDIQFMSVAKAQKLTSEEIADIRTTPEAQEGLEAFFEKRAPKWP